MAKIAFKGNWLKFSGQKLWYNLKGVGGGVAIAPVCKTGAIFGFAGASPARPTFSQGSSVGERSLGKGKVGSSILPSGSKIH